MKTVNIHEAKTHFSRLLQAAADGEEIIIARAGMPVAKLVGLAASQEPRSLGVLAGKVKESKECWAPDAELEAQFYGDADESRSRRVAERTRRK